jgi:hypothetical protein
VGMTEEDPQKLAEELEREAEDLERRSEELHGKVDEARQDWERKRADPGVPGAAPVEDHGPEEHAGSAESNDG